MANKQDQINNLSDTLKDILIVQLLQAGVPQQKTREIAKCSINRVSEIGKAIPRRGAGRA